MYNFKPSFVPIESPVITFQIHTYTLHRYYNLQMMVCICMYNNMVFPKKKIYTLQYMYVPSLEIRILTYPNLWNILNYT